MLSVIEEILSLIEAHPGAAGGLLATVVVVLTIFHSTVVSLFNSRRVGGVKVDVPKIGTLEMDMDPSHTMQDGEAPTNPAPHYQPGPDLPPPPPPDLPASAYEDVYDDLDALPTDPEDTCDDTLPVWCGDA